MQPLRGQSCLLRPQLSAKLTSERSASPGVDLPTPSPFEVLAIGPLATAPLWGSQSWLSSWARGPPINRDETRRSIVGRLPTGCRPAADWQSACRHAQRIFNRLRWAFDRAAAFQRRSPRPRRAVLNRRQPGDRFTQNKGLSELSLERRLSSACARASPKEPAVVFRPCRLFAAPASNVQTQLS
jgi:hypothetical protein